MVDLGEEIDIIANPDHDVSSPLAYRNHLVGPAGTAWRAASRRDPSRISSCQHSATWQRESRSSYCSLRH
jgi:hypothetical protein